jgi:hypothetical protein
MSLISGGNNFFANFTYLKSNYELSDPLKTRGLLPKKKKYIQIFILPNIMNLIGPSFKCKNQNPKFSINPKSLGFKIND